MNAQDNISARTAITTVPGHLLELMRPSQWVKNVVVFAGPAAGLRLLDPLPLLHTAITFLSFCFAASATYAINDVVDREADARHPTKRDRPVARGAVPPATACTLGAALLLVSCSLSLFVPTRRVTLVVLLYFALTLSYSLALKRLMLLDVLVISIGFVLRALAGALAAGVVASEWLIACMFTLCLFLGFGKRRCELAMIGGAGDAGHHRATLLRYTPDLLNHLITVSAGIAVMTFLLYTMEPSRIPTPFPKEQLFFTLPIVVYGVFRFAMITELGLFSGPTEIVLRDRGTRAAILLWAAAALVVVYQTKLFGPGGLSRILSLGS